MEQERKIYDIQDISKPEKNLGLLIDEYFDYENILNAFFSDIMTLANGFDFKKSDEIVEMIDDMDISDESLMFFPYFLKDVILDKRLQSRVDLFTIVVANLFHLNKIFNERGVLLKDELEKVNDRLDLYRAMIYDFSRKLKRVFVG